MPMPAPIPITEAVDRFMAQFDDALMAEIVLDFHLFGPGIIDQLAWWHAYTKLRTVAQLSRDPQEFFIWEMKHHGQAFVDFYDALYARLRKALEATPAPPLPEDDEPEGPSVVTEGEAYPGFPVGEYGPPEHGTELVSTILFHSPGIQWETAYLLSVSDAKDKWVLWERRDPETDDAPYAVIAWCAKEELSEAEVGTQLVRAYWEALRDQWEHEGFTSIRGNRREFDAIHEEVWSAEPPEPGPLDEFLPREDRDLRRTGDLEKCRFLRDLKDRKIRPDGSAIPEEERRAWLQQERAWGVADDD